jgi:curved DNA-binding protein CbpA/CheY-like chemotaxis protein
MAGERILLIEHDPRIREFAARVLDDLDFVVFEVDNANGGLELFEHERPTLVLVEEALPWVGGLDVCVRLLTLDPELPLVLISGGPADSPMLREARTAYGIRNILIRPFDAAALTAAISDALGVPLPRPAAPSGPMAARIEPAEPPLPRKPYGLGGPVLTEAFVADIHTLSIDAPLESLDGLDEDEVESSFFHDADPPSVSRLRAEVAPSARDTVPPVAAEPVSEPEPPYAEQVSDIQPARDDEGAYALRPMVPANPSEPQGIYGEIPLGDLLYNAFRDIFTGRLVLQRGNVTKWITLRNGFPIQVESNVRSEDLGWRLHFDGILDEARHARYRQMVDTLGVEPQQALSDLGAIGPAELFEVQRKLVRERILGCFDWSGGRYGLSYDPHVADRLTAFEVNPLVLIFEGIKRSFPIAPLVSHFDGHGGLPVRRTEKLRDYGRLLKDFPDEMRFAEVCDGVVTVGGLIATSQFGLVDTLRTLRALEIMKCVAFDRGEAAPAGRPSIGMAPIRDRGTQPGAVGTPTLPPPVAAAPPRPLRPSSPPPAVRPVTLPPTGSRSSGAQPVMSPSGRPTGAAEPLGPMSSGSHSVVRPAPQGGFTGESTVSRRTDPGVARPGSEDVVRILIHEKFTVLAQATHYDVLEVSTEAPVEAIRSAFMRLARLAHPDQLGPGADDDLRRRATEVQRRVALAWEVLSDPKRRQEYDLLHIAPVGDSGGKPDIVKAESNFQKGRTCLAKGENRRALDFFEAAARQDNHQAAYRIYRGWTRYLCADANDNRTRHEAREEIKSALSADESQDAGYLFLGQITKASGNEELAERFFRKTLALNPANADALRELRLLETRRREKPKEGGLFNRILGPKK